MICPECGQEMHWHGDPIGGFLCDYCDAEILSKALRGDCEDYE